MQAGGLRYGRPGGLRYVLDAARWNSTMITKTRLAVMLVALSLAIIFFSPARNERGGGQQPDQTIDANPPNSTFVESIDSTPIALGNNGGESRSWVDASLPEAVWAAFIRLQRDELDDAAREAFILALRAWAENDPANAGAWSARLPIGTIRGEALDNVAIVWANKEYSEAVAWAEQLVDSDEQSRVIGCIANEVVRAEPVEALRLAVGLASGVVRDELMLRSIREWATRDAAAAVAWSQQIPDGPLRERILAAAATEWGDSDPVAAATFVASNMPTGRTQADAVVSIVQRWAQQDFEGAIGWVAMFPAGDLRTDALSVISDYQ
jgi:hypothetical protein